jgi:DNA-binding transcriptional LysR family regulator
MELHQVRYFLAVCQTLNFTRASEICHVSQPALSRAIQQLEAELGGDLFRRERSFTHMTEFGRSVHPALQQCYDASESAKAIAASFRKGGKSPFNLALGRSLDMEHVTSVLREVAEAFPNVEINIFRGPPHEIADKMKSGDVEIALVEPLENGWERFDARKLYNEEFGLLINKGHVLAARDRLGLEDMLNERLLSRPHCSLTNMLVEKLKTLGAVQVARHEVPLIDDLAEMVKANLGIGIWPKSKMFKGELQLNEIQDYKMSSWINLYTISGRKHSIGAATFVRLLRSKDWSALGMPPSPVEASQARSLGAVN